ncbi:MAG: tRNA uridine-5-carboxymethylaminomethyl(34) synthesis GTPase MnmE [Candidatus Marinimicrobia bacterium]|nr:tRNA uridine-5-carboxymethylaminomethyl(34) synthesis GTPase MnmE [Candidatus Neomarinimicrobiota bacterium]
MKNKYLFDDTICAIATPVGLGGIAVIRVSGKKALNSSLKILEIENLKPRMATYTQVTDKNTKSVIDSAVVTYFKSPHSYTGEDVVEISCHGGITTPNRILKLLHSVGIRLAEPGEFTRRAFINGKLDLLQAEAVGDVINSISENSQKIAEDILEGRLSKLINKIKDKLVEISSILELELDFSEEEINPLPKDEINKKIKNSVQLLEELSKSYNSGKIKREGVLIPIVGKPNAGKSSLLNALLKENRAIISNTPGTTRDSIEEVFKHHGNLFRLVDTAGLRSAKNEVEKIGIERTNLIIKKGDIILLISDVTQFDSVENEISNIRSLTDVPIIVALNKSDLLKGKTDIVKNDQMKILISAKYEKNLDKLLKLLSETAEKTYKITSESVAICHLRHKQAIESAIDSLNNSINAINENMSNEFIAFDIQNAVTSLNDITGQTTSQDVLNNIFSNFCIGK